jgi:hypothetical protein
MVFSLAKDFLLLAAKKYKLDNHAISSLVCEKTRQIIAKEFPQHIENWQLKKFVGGRIFISAKNSAASSELFLKTNQLLEFILELDLPTKIEGINIVKE